MVLLIELAFFIFISVQGNVFLCNCVRKAWNPFQLFNFYVIGKGIFMTLIKCSQGNFISSVVNFMPYKVDIWITHHVIFILNILKFNHEKCIWTWWWLLYALIIWGLTSDTCTHCGLMIPCRDINLGQHSLRYWLGAWQHQAIGWTMLTYHQ